MASGQDLMAARQWAGQLDCHVTLSGKEHDTATDERGRPIERTAVVMKVEKLRDGFPPAPIRVVIESVKDEDGRTVSLAVRSDGPVQSARSQEHAELSEAIYVALKDGPLKHGHLVGRRYTRQGGGPRLQDGHEVDGR